MTMRELVEKDRSYRRYYEEKTVPAQTLRDLTALARLAPSAGNRQALKYYLCADPALSARVNDTLTWAAYFEGWVSPPVGERPPAFIIVLCDKAIQPRAERDAGIAAQTILLGAAEIGLSGCMLGSVDRDALLRALALSPDAYAVELVLAVGYGKENIVLEPVGADGSIKYRRDANGTHYVPKRSLDEIIVSPKEDASCSN